MTSKLDMSERYPIDARDLRTPLDQIKEMTVKKREDAKRLLTESIKLDSEAKGMEEAILVIEKWMNGVASVRRR